MKQFVTWSYSQVNCWQQCPHRANLTYLEKVPQGPPSPALERGSAIHKEAEDYLNRKTKTVTSNLFLFEEKLKELRRLKPQVELVLGLDRNWRPTNPFGKDRWLKVILDVHRKTQKTVFIGDWKTGKMRVDQHQKQMGLYAAVAIANGAEEVNTQLWYVDHGKTHSERYTADEMQDMIDAWSRPVTMMEADTIFPKKPGPLCGWCPYHGTVHCEF